MNNPVIQPQGQQVGLYVYINVCPAGLGYSLIGTSSEAGLCFTNASVWASGGEDHVSVQAGVALRTNMVDMVSATIDWFVLPTGASNWCSAGTSGPHTNYVTWGWPSTYPKNTATLIRIDKVCNVAKGASSEAAIGDKIGPQATSRDLFYTNSIFSNLTQRLASSGRPARRLRNAIHLNETGTRFVGGDGFCGELDVYACSTNSGWSPLVGDQPSSTSWCTGFPGMTTPGSALFLEAGTTMKVAAFSKGNTGWVVPGTTKRMPRSCCTVGRIRMTRRPVHGNAILTKRTNWYRLRRLLSLLIEDF